MSISTCEAVLGYNKKCKSEKGITPTHCFDPEHPIDVITIINCNECSNAILTPYLQSYLEIQDKISALEQQRKENKIQSRYYEMNSVPNISEELSSLYKKRRILTTDICRDPYCSKPLDKKVYTAFPFGQDGRVRHELRFHKGCWQKFQWKLGYNREEQLFITN